MPSWHWGDRQSGSFLPVIMRTQVSMAKPRNKKQDNNNKKTGLVIKTHNLSSPGKTETAFFVYSVSSRSHWEKLSHWGVMTSEADLWYTCTWAHIHIYTNVHTHGNPIVLQLLYAVLDLVHFVMCHFHFRILLCISHSLLWHLPLQPPKSLHLLEPSIS